MDPMVVASILDGKAAIHIIHQSFISRNLTSPTWRYLHTCFNTNSIKESTQQLTSLMLLKGNLVNQYRLT